MILETFLMEEKRACARETSKIFSECGLWGKIGVYAGPPGAEVRQSVLFLNLGNGRPRASGGVSAVRRRFRGIRSASCAHIPERRLCAAVALQERASTWTPNGGYRASRESLTVTFRSGSSGISAVRASRR
jgi:hypothetical protein